MVGMSKVQTRSSKRLVVVMAAELPIPRHFRPPPFTHTHTQYTSRAAQLYKQLLEKEANKLAIAGVAATSPSAAEAELAALALDATAATSNGKAPEEDAAPSAVEESKPAGVCCTSQRV